MRLRLNWKIKILFIRMLLLYGAGIGNVTTDSFELWFEEADCAFVFRSTVTSFHTPPSQI